ncbi:MAG: hypothetical protein JWR10_3419 [Rubritepida sp.]|nr:hypothetical protein [Rubritepida sp.]
MSGRPGRAAYAAAAKSGLTMAQAARRLGVHASAVARMAKRHSLRFVRGVGKPGPEIWTPERRAVQRQAMCRWHVENRA